MAKKPPALTSAALKLPMRQRAELARALLLSLDGKSRSNSASRKWTTEVAHRAVDVVHGNVALLDARLTVQGIRARLAKKR